MVIYEISAQEQIQVIKQKKVSLKAGYSLVKKDTSFYAIKDTIVYVPIQQEYFIRKGYSSKDFFSTIHQKSSRYRITREIANTIIKASEKRLPSDTLNTKLSESYFDTYQNLVIRKIQYKRLEPFGPTVYDTTIRAKLWYQKAGNATHIRTAQWIVRNNMLFKNGDLVNPAVIADNERLLRQLSFIQDAKISISGVSSNGDSVDIDVITKDVWSIGASINSPDQLKTGSLRLWDNNLLGLGKVYDNRIYWNVNKKDTLGYSGLLRLDNINGSFVNAIIDYKDYYGTQSFSTVLARNFFTPKIKWAGGANADYVSTFQQASPQDTIISPLSYRDAGFWLARSFQLSNDVLSPIRQNLVLSGSVNYYDFLARPIDVSADRFYRFHDRVLLLGSIAFTRQGFYKSNLIYNFGRTEDIPYGYMVNFTGGSEKSEFKQRVYTSFHLSHANYLGRHGYLYSAVGLGSFWNSKNPEQSIFKTQFNYFSNLQEIGQSSVRQFISLTYLQGFNMFSDEYTTINSLQGIRGYQNSTIMGLTKMILSFETTVFSPFYVLGFRFVFFGFADAALIGSSRYVFDNSDYYGLGLGMRVKNERLVIPALQIRFAYYSAPTQSGDHYVLDFIGESRLNPKDFYVRQPDLLKFQ